ncbi:amidase domain-containing protein [Clostridium botulinum]|uniref:amidase domain-containing protein n=1 Tax=Clostridium botulinum TaxID=1491 RepID=UPI0004D922A4|nr:amidase domain-containing protein [Clostridium botulinum]KEH95181.1 hypothetical protein Z963_03705 [Clostridium botulinum C/D str. It1]
MGEYYKKNYKINHLNSNYNRSLAKAYAEKYALTPNTNMYPYFENDDCANFVSQVLRAGGMLEEGSDWDRVESWFCRTNSTESLSNISITWRAARYFRRYFGNEDGFGENKAAMYIETTARKVLYNFKEIYAFLDIGDVIQYGSTYSKIPYHTQVIVDKKFNPVIGRYDLFMAQHTKNAVDVSFYNYLSRFEDKEIRPVYIYKIKMDT